MKKTISIITPLFNEVDNLVPLCERIKAVMEQMPYEYEHICIDNFSQDGTRELLRERARSDKRLKVILNSRNFGHIRSPYHALLQATGDCAIIIAGDLQDPPELMLEFVKKWEQGYKSVMAVKPKSQEFPLMFVVRKVYYRLIGKISETPLVENATGAGLYDRVVLDALRKIDDPYPYMRGLICEIGYPIATVPFLQPARTRGVTSQNFYSLYDVAMLGIVKHSRVPLRLVTLSGFIIGLLSFLVAVGYLMAKIFFWDSFELGMAPILIGMFFIASIQLSVMGLFGEYIGSILMQVRNLPLVIEAERINFDELVELEKGGDQ